MSTLRRSASMESSVIDSGHAASNIMGAGDHSRALAQASPRAALCTHRRTVINKRSISRKGIHNIINAAMSWRRSMKKAIYNGVKRNNNGSYMTIMRLEERHIQRLAASLSRHLRRLISALNKWHILLGEAQQHRGKYGGGRKKKNNKQQ